MSKSDLSTVRLANPETDSSLLRAVEEFQQNKSSLSFSVVSGENEDDYAPEHQEKYVYKDVSAEAVQASYSDGLFKNEGRYRNLFLNATNNTEWNLGYGRNRELNGIVYDAQGNPVNGEDEEEDNALENFKDQVDDFNERQFEKRHNVNQSYQEWSETDQAFGSVHMSGKDWERIQSWLQNKDNRKKAEEKLKQEGYSADQINKIFRANEIMAKPPSQWTPEETEFIRRQERDPEISRGVDIVAYTAKGNGVELSNESATSIAGGRDTSAMFGRSVFADNSGGLENGQNAEQLATNDRSVTSIARVSDNTNLFSNAPEIRPAFEVASSNTLSTTETPAPAPARTIAPVIADAGFG